MNDTNPDYVEASVNPVCIIMKIRTRSQPGVEWREADRDESGSYRTD